MTPLAPLPNHRCSSPGNSKPLCLLDHSTPRAAVCLHRRPLTVQQTTCSTVSWTRPGCCYAAPQHQQHQPQQAQQQLQQAAASSDNQQLQYPLVERKFDHNWRSPLAGAATPPCHRRHLLFFTVGVLLVALARPRHTATSRRTQQMRLLNPCICFV